MGVAKRLEDAGVDKPLPIASAVAAEVDDVADYLEDAMERQYGQLQTSIATTNAKIDKLEEKLTVSFRWKVTTVVAVIGVVLTALGFIAGFVRLSLPATGG